MTPSFLDGLPTKPSRTQASRVGLFVLLGWVVFGGAGCIGGMALGFPNVAGASGALFLLWHVGGVIAQLALQTRAKRALDEATVLVATDRRAACAKAAEALRAGVGDGKRALEAWLIVAQAAEEAGALADADEALARGLHRPRYVDRGFLVHAHLLRAFVKAAKGDVDGAEREIGTFGTVDLANPLLFAEYMRARAMILYRRARYKEVIDVANEARGRAAIRNERDAVLYASLEHSCMLRLEAAAGHHPMRVAHPVDAEAWLAEVEPELAKSAHRR